MESLWREQDLADGKGVLGYGSVPEHVLSSNVVPGEVWQEGREVDKKRGRSHIRNILQGTGSW